MKCEICGEPVTSKYATRFCSRACANSRQRPRNVGTCGQCGCSFRMRPRKSKRGAPRPQRFCSITCYRESVKAPEKKCQRCGDSIPQTSWSYEAKFCSFACYIVTPRKVNERSARVYNTFWQRQRLRAIERDGHCCSDCGSTESLVVHHIEPYRISGSHALENLQTLCSRCHRLADHRYQQGERVLAAPVPDPPDSPDEE